MTAPHAPHASPTTTERAIGPTAGDALADAVVAELDLLGTPAQQALDAGLRNGLASLYEPPPEAVAALLRQLESAPSGMDPLMLHRGDVVSLSVPPLWFGLCSVTATLTHTYASPAAAGRLARAGTPTAMAPRRLAGTGVWARRTMRPGGLLRGAPGYLATVQLRLLQARIRITAFERDRESAESAEGGASGRTSFARRRSPLAQDDDLARTWLGLTLVSFRALAAVGIEIGPEEERYLYRYWSYVAHLLGLDESLYGNVLDHTDAEHLRGLLDARTAVPDENSRVLTTAMVDTQARAMAGAPGAVLSEEQLRYLIHSVLRQAFGDETADRLDIPVPAATHLMPLIGKLNRQSRYWQTFSPASAGEARRRALQGPGPELIAAVLPVGRQNREAAGRSGVPAA
ncbi:oxygenase MpaB family protein [Streptomyces europaeiscabiei]|uniref:oxygenase MpaB family protein n=1 Tax=Streptomyces europaeiscabiei TaxID=146819 RepID=UPI00076603F7|nr:oxygenase MpaB family protein [Streptomyces europaeiscabiei]MDX3665024.1 oxygenase MpaB family protein [Streptomyces europaeiscabiei]